jgi:hypothetical protein
MRPPLSRAALALRSAILFLPIGIATFQASCWVYVDDCDDDDFDEDDDDDGYCDDDDDDHHGHLSPPAEPSGRGDAVVPPAFESLRLANFVVVPAVGDPAAHPVRRLVGIEGLAVELPFPGSPDETEALRAFTARVLSDNPDLLALPPGAGRWTFDRIERSGEFLSVIWRQELAAVARALVAPGRPLGELVFLFDAAGRLVEIDDTARVRFD